MNINIDLPSNRMEDNEMKYLKNIVRSIDLRMDHTSVKLASTVKEKLNKPPCNDLLDNDMRAMVSVSGNCKSPVPSVLHKTHDSIDSSLNQRCLTEKWSLTYYCQPIKCLFMTGELFQSRIDDVSQERSGEVSTNGCTIFVISTMFLCISHYYM